MITKIDLLDALIEAHHAASKQNLTSGEIEFGYRCGVREVARQLGLNVEFRERLDAVAVAAMLSETAVKQ